jgi:hypothetical protein
MLGPGLLLKEYRRLFHQVQSGRDVALTTRLHLAPRLGVRRVLLPVPLYAFMASTGTT